MTPAGEESHRILGVLVKVRVEDALIHEVGFALDGEQHPAQVMQLERRQAIGLVRHRLLDVLRVLVKDRLAAGNDFRDDRESVTGGGLWVNRTVLSLPSLVGLLGHCHRLRFDLHIGLPFV